MKKNNYKEYFKTYVQEVINKILPNNQEIEKILDSNKKDYEKQREIQKIIYDYSLDLTGDEKQEFDKKLMELTEEFEISISKKIEKTIIQKININKGEINYQGVGEVPGRVLNQFSMDEYNENFRIATTTGDSWRDTSLNHLYVLNKNLEIIGSVDDLAQGERIYSVRFLGDRAYMVTFKQVDPLFVIDLENPKNPEVLGYLKITGFSNYLHPYDENHIIGIGREATEQGRAQGVKIALFDVSDVENPIEISKYEVGAEWSEKHSWSDSEALHDHKAVLFDKEKELLVIPISYTRYLNNDWDYKNREYWQGAYVFKVNLEGIKLRGSVSHFQGDDNKWSFNVRRSLYMDNTLYTISNFKVKANDLESLDFMNEVRIAPTESYI